MRNVVVRLTDEEEDLAIWAAFHRIYRDGSRVHADEAGYQGDPIDRLTNDIFGACAEVAVARMLGMDDWEPTVDTFHSEADIGKDIEVRWASKHDYQLLVRPRDHDERRYVLVVGYPPVMKVVGWCDGRDAKDARYWIEMDDGRPGCYMIPQLDLSEFNDSSVRRNDGAD